MPDIVRQPKDWRPGGTDNTIWHMPTGTAFLITTGVTSPDGGWMEFKDPEATPVVADPLRVSSTELIRLRNEAQFMARFLIGLVWPGEPDSAARQTPINRRPLEPAISAHILNLEKSHEL